MITIRFDLKDEKLEALCIEELAAHFEYPAEVLAPVVIGGQQFEQTVANTESKEDFVKRSIGVMLKSILVHRFLVNSGVLNAPEKTRESIEAKFTGDMVS